MDFRFKIPIDLIDDLFYCLSKYSGAFPVSFQLVTPIRLVRIA